MQRIWLSMRIYIFFFDKVFCLKTTIIVFDFKHAAGAVTPLVEEFCNFTIVGQEQEEDAGKELPDFILNALIREKKTIDQKDCPFKSYIDLKQNAWEGEGESRYLIVRKNYYDLYNFLYDQFKAAWKSGVTVPRVVTGTAGIGKTMFALLFARILFQQGSAVLLHYENNFWAFTKKLLKSTKTFLDKEIKVGGTKIYFTFGTDSEDKGRLHAILARPNIVTIRDCGKFAMEWLSLARGHILCFVWRGRFSWNDGAQVWYSSQLLVRVC